MKGESLVINFLCSLIPGVGFMYNGLYKKGISFLVLWFLIIKFDHFLGLGLFSPIILIPIWFYCFFKTFDVNRKVRKGEYVEDNFLFSNANEKYNIKGNSSMYIGIALVVIGALSILSNLLKDLNIDFNIMHYIGPYFVPLIFIIIGIYVLLTGFRKK